MQSRIGVHTLTYMRTALFLALIGCSSHMTFDDDAAPQDSGKDISAPDSCTSPVAYWPDVDGDGFGDSLSAPIMACVKPANTVGNNKDCGDGDPLMRPDQTKSQMGPAKGKTAGSPYDFNCDGKEDMDAPGTPGSCAVGQMGQCSGNAGWLETPMMCSGTYKFLAQCSTINGCQELPVDMRHPNCL